MMNELEQKLLLWFKENPKYILSYMSMINYDKDNWLLEKVYVEDANKCTIYVKLFPEYKLPLSIMINIPKQFYREQKLKRILK